MDDAVSTSISGMTCMSCVGRVKDALSSLEGAYNINVNLDSGKVSLQGVALDVIEQTIISLGYGVGNTEHVVQNSEFNWKDGGIWKQSAHNTKWCLIGCSIGDFGTIAAFQLLWPNSGWAPMWIMALAMMNGILTSITLETFILMKQMGGFKEAFRVAIGMSLISMLGMEAAMNATDLLLTGGAMLTWWVIPIMLLAGFLTPWPYNYWRLKKYGISCH
jgi:copper chaperone CopZ